MSRTAILAMTAALVTMVLVANSAYAVPILQLYLEGGTYNEQTESWELTQEGTSGGAPIRLWAIGNVDGPGGKGTISDVKLALAYDVSYSGIQITVDGGLTTGGYGGYTDDTPSAAPVYHQTVVGGTPKLSDGRDLPSHGVYGDETMWQEYLLGDFDLTDSPIEDFIGGFPDAPTRTRGQINVYEISVFGGHGATIHFDLYDHVDAKNHTNASFSPFSHDGDADNHVAPEPATLAIWSLLSLLGLAAAYRKRVR